MEDPRDFVLCELEAQMKNASPEKCITLSHSSPSVKVSSRWSLFFAVLRSLNFFVSMHYSHLLMPMQFENQFVFFWLYFCFTQNTQKLHVHVLGNT